MIPRTLFTSEHETFRASVRRFLEAEVKPFDERWQEQGYADKAVWKKAGENGYLCMSMPEEYGGYGFMWEFPISQAYVDARVTRIYGGTNEIMKEVISRSLGLGGKDG